jgi:hypothetical protein
MKIKTLIPFVVILALLAGIVVWQKMNQAPPAPIATQIGLTTLAPDGLDKDDVARMELFAGSNPDEKVVLEKQEDTWRIASAFNAPVNAETLEGFLDKALALKGEPRAKENTESQLADYALKDDEAFHVQLYKSGTETPAMHVLFGKSADFRTVFVRKDGDNQVFVESTNLRREAGVSDSGEDVTPKPTKWLQTTLLEQPKESINRVALQYPDKEIVFERHEIPVEKPESTEGEGEGEAAAPAEPATKVEWKLAQGGFSETFTDAELQTLLSKFAALTITNAVDPEQKAAWGFDPPLYKLTLSRDDGEDIVLLGGQDKPSGDRYVQLQGSEPPLIYQMAKFNFDQIFPQGSKLFTLPEWTLEKDAITQVQIQRPDGLVVLAKEGENWRVTDPVITLELQKTTIDNLVATASTLKPVDYADAGQNSGNFDTTITVTTNDGQIRVLHLGQPSVHTDGCYVKFDDSDKVLVLSRADMEKLNPPVRDLYSLSVMEFDQEAIEQIAVSHNGTELVLARDAADADKWQRTVNGKSAATTLNDVEEFVYTLNAFQVDNFLLSEAVDTLQAASTITVNQTGKDPVVLSLSAEIDGAYKAVISELPYVFSVKSDEISNIVSDMQVFLEMPAEEAPETVGEVSTPTESATPTAPESIVIPSDAVEAAAPADNAAVASEVAETVPVVVLPPPANATTDTAE